MRRYIATSWYQEPDGKPVSDDENEVFELGLSAAGGQNESFDRGSTRESRAKWFELPPSPRSAVSINIANSRNTAKTPLFSSVGFMSWFELIFLAIIQGIAEFLPISSSGHLVIAEAVLGIESEQTSLNIALHFGTLLSILVFYFRRVMRLLFEDRRVILKLIVGSIPVGIVGVTIKLLFADILHSALLAGCMLPLTGAMLIWGSKAKAGEVEYADASLGKVFLIGICQAFALLPGVSRSGMTISGGMVVGLKRQSAATFAFLLAIPAIGGATILELKDVAAGDLDSAMLIKLAVGAAIAFAVGLASLAWLVKLLEKGKLHWFAYWCIPLGIGVIIWQVILMTQG